MAAARVAARYVSRKLSTSGKVLSEEEKAAENVYMKKIEKEKLEKLAHKDAKTQEPPASVGVSETDVKPSTHSGSSTTGVSTDKNRNYAVLAGTVAIFSAVGWYFMSKPKKVEEVQD